MVEFYTLILVFAHRPCTLRTPTGQGIEELWRQSPHQTRDGWNLWPSAVQSLVVLLAPKAEREACARLEKSCKALKYRRVSVVYFVTNSKEVRRQEFYMFESIPLQIGNCCSNMFAARPAGAVVFHKAQTIK